MKNNLFVNKIKNKSSQNPVALSFGGCSKNDKKDGKEGKDGDGWNIVKPTDVKTAFKL